MIVQNLFHNYPDVMSTKELAECLQVSTKLATKLLKDKVIYSVMVGRSYRVSKKNVIEYLSDSPRMLGNNHCVVNVTSNPKDWTSEKLCGIVSADKEKEEN